MIKWHEICPLLLLLSVRNILSYALIRGLFVYLSVHTVNQSKSIYFHKYLKYFYQVTEKQIQDRGIVFSF